MAGMELNKVAGGWWHFLGEGSIQPDQLLARMVTVPQHLECHHAPCGAGVCLGEQGWVRWHSCSLLMSVHPSSCVRGELHLQGE